ncbi:hypothetical protein [Elizabethkingia anophelis]|uniref:hypothetical protein n=1 Tax=Elizabethkingia anophelis TaxID=1117645 RepID=UPI00378704A5
MLLFEEEVKHLSTNEPLYLFFNCTGKHKRRYAKNRFKGVDELILNDKQGLCF